MTLHGLVEAQAARSPDAVAVAFEGARLTYRELNARADAVAYRLCGLGVGPETLVAVCAERSLELPVALLGVLKAGAAYLPLDPEYPADRLAFMLEDAAAPVVLAQESLRGQLPPTSATVLALDDRPAGRRRRAGWRARAGDLAYAIYTSGSTGRPKGVLNTHRGIVNRLDWMQRRYRLDPGDVVLQKTPASFDVSVWEFFWPLLAGARMVLARPGGHKDAAYLRDLIRARGGDHRPLRAVHARRLPGRGGRRGRRRRPMPGAAPDHLQRRGAPGRRGGPLPADAPGRAAQPLRADRGGDRRLGLAVHARRPGRPGAGADRRPDPEPDACTSSTRSCGPCRSACPGSCSSAASGWRADTCAAPR